MPPTLPGFARLVLPNWRLRFLPGFARLVLTKWRLRFFPGGIGRNWFGEPPKKVKPANAGLGTKE